jgi:hypothetical protein
MVVGGELTDSGQRGQRKCSVEIENTQEISVGNPERKRLFGRSRPR